MESVSAAKSKREKKYFICQLCSPFNGLFSSNMILTKHWASLYITWEVRVSLCEIDLSLVGGGKAFCWPHMKAKVAAPWPRCENTVLCIARTKEHDKCFLHKFFFFYSEVQHVKSSSPAESQSHNQPWWSFTRGLGNLPAAENNL